jgi:N-acetylneuraminic acid mutarotase
MSRLFNRDRARAQSVVRQAVIETLEGRQLMHAGHDHFNANVDFQLTATPIWPGYVADLGATFADRGNGFVYGWSKSHADTARDRNSTKSPDNRYDTFITMKGGAKWEIEVPNGEYDVRVAAGDAITWVSRRYDINVEGVRAFDFVPTSANRFVEGTVTVTVTDGRLTLTNGVNGYNNNLDFVEITTHGDGEEPPPETLPANPTNAVADGISVSQARVTWSDNADNEDGYRIYRKLGDGGTYALVGTVDPNETEFLDNGLAANSTYIYRVVAFNALGESGFSNEDSATTFASAPSGTTIDWQTVAPSPIKRAEALGGVVNGKLYVLGGLFSSNGKILATTRCDVYDPATNTWKQLKNAPEKLTHAGTVIVGDTIWLVGGYVGDHPGPGTRHVWKYNTSNDTWSRGPDLPFSRGAGGAAIVNNTIYFFGGMNYDRTWSADTAWGLNLANQGAGWVKKANFINPRNHTSAVAIGGYVYAIGGQYAQEEHQVAQREIDRYDPVADKWEKVADLPTVRSHILSSTFVMNGKLVIIGGETAYNTVVRNVTMWDPTTNTFTELTPLPAGRSTSVAGVLPDGRLISSTGNNPNESTTTWIGTFV